MISPVILCGGYGSRLWPLSRQSFPKQYLSLNPESKYSLLQNTFQRILNIEEINDPILICNEEHRFIAAEQMREIDVKPRAILLEPFGRNTAPAIALGAMLALEEERDPILLVLSSDHAIKNTQNFCDVIKSGIPYVKEGKLVTFGIAPNSAETGYGYIKAARELHLDEIKGKEILEFVEKPDKKKANEFLKDKRYYWNSGIFLFKAKKILNEILRSQPEIINCCSSSLKNRSFDLDFQRINKNDFKRCPNISIDVAVMENVKEGIVIPLNAEWNDVGNWKSIWEESDKDENNNAIQGRVLSKNNENCYIRSEGRLIVGVGLKNLIIVDTADAILVAEKESSQKIKNIVSELKNKNFSESSEHQKVYRPWGFFRSIAKDLHWQVKLIQVNPGQKISLQMHHHRSEHWIILKGTAQIEIDENSFLINENQSCYIPLGAKHRLNNPGDVPVSLIEVQSGDYLGEDDIKRFEDCYGRAD